jgi:hypothetical protein
MRCQPAERTGLCSGQRLASRVCSVSVIVIDAGRSSEGPQCGGLPMDPAPIVPCGGTDVTEDSWAVRGGVTYCDPATDLVVRCTRPGRGPLTVQGRSMIPHELGESRSLT